MSSMLSVVGYPEFRLEVFALIDELTVACLILEANHTLALGMGVEPTGEVASIPVGSVTLGRVLNSLGKPEDGHAFTARTYMPLYGGSQQSLTDIQVPHEILETGIKAVDFFAPMFRGGKLGLFGGAGLGKTVLLTELMNSIVVRAKKKGSKRVSVFTAVGERIREAKELVDNLKEAGVQNDTVLVMGQMGENPALRFRTAFAGVTMAEHFRDELGMDVLFFVDNMYRFAQAGYEIATQQSLIPSEDGYQPNLPTQVGSLHERLISTKKAAITTIEAVYLPSDDMSDYSVRTILSYLDSVIVLSRDVYQEGRLPAIDLLASTSSALQPEFVSEKHYETYGQARSLLEHARELERIVSLVGMSELSPENKQIYRRAQALKYYMTQPFVVTEGQSGIPGEYVPLETTVKDVADILAGKHDAVEPDSLLLKGAL
jgi:F-type H+-transporting ATPase subunit beta